MPTVSRVYSTAPLGAAALLVLLLSGCHDSPSTPATGAPAAPASDTASAAQGEDAPHAQAAPAAPTATIVLPAAASGPIPLVTVSANPGAVPASMAPPPPDQHTLNGLGLTIRMTGDIRQIPTSIGGTGVLVSGPNGCEVQVTLADRGARFDIKAQKQTIQGDTVRWRRFTHVADDPTGWEIQYETEGLADPKGTAYGLNVRRNVGGVDVICARILETPGAASCALDACNSISRDP